MSWQSTQCVGFMLVMCQLCVSDMLVGRGCWLCPLRRRNMRYKNPQLVVQQLSYIVLLQVLVDVSLF